MAARGGMLLLEAAWQSLIEVSTALKTVGRTWQVTFVGSQFRGLCAMFGIAYKELRVPLLDSPVRSLTSLLHHTVASDSFVYQDYSHLLSA